MKRVMFFVFLLSVIVISNVNTGEDPPTWAIYLNCVYAIGLLILIGPVFFGGADKEETPPRNRGSYFSARPTRDGIHVRTSDHPRDPLLNNNELSHPLLHEREYTYNGEGTDFYIRVCGAGEDRQVAAAVTEALRTVRANTGRSACPEFQDAVSFLQYVEGNGAGALKQPGRPALARRRQAWREFRGE